MKWTAGAPPVTDPWWGLLWVVTHGKELLVVDPYSLSANEQVGRFLGGREEGGGCSGLCMQRGGCGGCRHTASSCWWLNLTAWQSLSAGKSVWQAYKQYSRLTEWSALAQLAKGYTGGTIVSVQGAPWYTACPCL